jgi:HPr kinase/phosphorylase
MELQRDVFHATTICIDGKGVLIIGPSGAGKSGLALELMAMGAVLVADDRTLVTRHQSKLRATVPATIRGKIEARGVGILSVPDAGQTDLVLVVDLGKTIDSRLPEQQTHNVLGVPLDCLHRVPNSHFAASILFYVKGITIGTYDPET